MSLHGSKQPSELSIEHRGSVPSAPKENQTRSNVKKMVTVFENGDKFKSKGSLEPDVGNVKISVAAKSVRSTEHIEEGDDLVKGSTSMSLKRFFKEADKTSNLAVIPNESKIVNEVVVREASSTTSPYHSEEHEYVGFKRNAADKGSLSGQRTDDGNGIFEKSVYKNLRLPKNVKFESLQVKEEEEKECVPLQNPHISKYLDESASRTRPDNLYRQASYPGVITNEKGDTQSRTHADQGIVPAISNGTVSPLTCFNFDGDHCGNHDVWTARRLCITTGASQLRDLVDCCTNSEGISAEDENSSIVSGDQVHIS